MLLQQILHQLRVRRDVRARTQPSAWEQPAEDTTWHDGEWLARVDCAIDDFLCALIRMHAENKYLMVDRVDGMDVGLGDVAGLVSMHAHAYRVTCNSGARSAACCAKELVRDLYTDKRVRLSDHS